MISAWFWVVWIIAVFGTFFALEIPAIRNDVPGDTLSERLRQWLGTHPRRKWGTIGSMIFLGAVMWFAFHIITNAV